MERARFFVPVEDKRDNKIIIDDGENTHLFSVLRLRVGDRIDVCLNDGNVYFCELADVNKKQSIANIIEVVTPQRRKNKIALFMALTKSERMDIAIQKCTELGVDEIYPFESEYCTVKDKGGKVERFNRVALAACKQSGRALLPIIYETKTFKGMLDTLKSFSQIVVAYENDGTNAREVLAKFDNTKDTAIIIGSEGGFSKKEIDELVERGAKVVSLGVNILRAETASIALLSALNYQFDFWKK